MKLKIVNPANEQMIREIPCDDARSIAEKFEGARLAQKTWGATSIAHRLETMRRFKSLLAERMEKLASVLTSEVGKPISQARNELKGTLPRLDFFIENTERVLREEIVFDDPTMKEVISHEPLGVIANISAWNFPYFVGTNVFVPALLAGNSVLYKPSEFATLTGLEIGAMLHEAGVPSDVFQVIVGTGSAGAALLELPLNGVFFTGSYATGRKIAESASRRLMKMQLELGGKDPVYVCEDADVRVATESLADGAFYNNGQSCCSVERIYVHERIFEAFTDSFLKAVKGFIVGDPTGERTYIGPVTRAPQLQILERQVADAKSKGAKLLTGGHRMERTGYYFEPTVFTGVNHTMELMREESFGPLIGIQSVSGDTEATKLMGETEYGLTAGVYSKDVDRARRILETIDSGTVYWNCCDRVSPRLPWSGRGHSGIGSTLSTYGILTFVQPKAWHLRPSK